ncbi:MAG: helix-turn-helix transcriptional regulator [Oscillospiraceae bacterium]|nr:helix-turn-helix transcriptional regulator [Oscillospiraceae bacterium]
MDEKFVQISDRLKEIRKEENLTQKAFADKMGVSQSSYSAYENGTSIPTLDFLMRLADTYDFSMDYVTGRSKNKKGLQGDRNNRFVKENMLTEDGKSEEERILNFTKAMREYIAIAQTKIDELENKISPDKK